MTRKVRRPTYTRRDALGLGAASIAAPLAATLGAPIISTQPASAVVAEPSRATASSKSAMAPTIAKVGESTSIQLGQYNPAKPSLRLNNRSPAHGPILTHNGWQYVAGYAQVGDPTVDPDIRRVVVARRNLQSGSWERLWLGDYDQVNDNNHFQISLGMCTVDDTLHLSFDQWNSPLRYRKSVPGLISDPTSFVWNNSLFGPVETDLGGEFLARVTYPTFATTPQGKLLFAFREGFHDPEDEPPNRWQLYEYDGITSGWTRPGVFLTGIDTGDGRRRPYPNGLTFGPGGVLHMTWTWRVAFDGTTNQDLMYAYSEDNGRTWKNNAGVQVATTDSDALDQASANVRVWQIPVGSSLKNTEGQAVDSAGRVHVVMRDDLDGVLQRIHYVRETDGTWHRHNTGIAVSLQDDRAKIVTDPADNAFILSASPRIYGATVANGYDDWEIVNDQDHGRFSGEVQYDPYRLDEDGKLSVHYQERAATPIRVLDYQFG